MKRRTKICIYAAVASGIFNIGSFFYCFGFNYLKMHGSHGIFSAINSLEMPPFGPGYWLIWNVLAIVSFAAAKGFFGFPDISYAAPMAPAIFFLIGSGLQTYLTALIFWIIINKFVLTKISRKKLE